MARRVLIWCISIALLPWWARAVAQTAADTARVYVTVLDPSNAGVPGATVTLVGVDETTKQATVAPASSGERGLATFTGVRPGRYSIQASFPGFDAGLLANVTVRRGDNRHVVALSLHGVSENVVVAGGQETSSSRTGSSFGLTMTQEAIDTLSDDPAELQRQLAELAGSDAIVRVDSFEGAQLPARSQIKSVHVTRDQFAAEAEYPGSTFVDIITQPGSGAISGTINLVYRANPLAGTSPFVSTKQPETNRNVNATIGGTLIKDRSDFSISIYGQNRYTTPVLRQANTTATVLGLRQPYTSAQANALVNYALTRDQTLRVGYAMARNQSKNLGIGQYDSPERAFDSDFTGFQVRAQEAGPIGRRTFQNTRLFVTSIEQSQRARVDLPTIVIQDDRTTGGAQVRGRTKQVNFFFASDVDHIRGINSWRFGTQINGGWFDSTTESGYLGTYTFADEASFSAGRPLLYTRTIGDPRVTYFNAQTAGYVQDDVRISKGLTISPGVRYMVQTHVHDASGFAPRVGTTWSPFASGHTAFRVSAGLFYWPMEMARVYEQTLRFDGQHQQQVLIVNPTYPDPGPLAGLPPTKYLLGDYSLQRNLRYSAGIDHTFTPRVRMNVLYAYWHQFDFWHGRNLNAPIDGVRPDPAFGNVMEALTDGQIRRHDLTVNFNLSLVAPGPASNQGRFNWKRVALASTYGRIRAWQTGDGPFTPSPRGTLDTEWAPNADDLPYRITASFTSTQLKNLNVNLAWNGSSGAPYTVTTGVDDNRDGILNDRPLGVPLRSQRAAAQSTLNLRVSYTMMTSAAGGGSPQGPGAPRRYRVALNVSATNLTNRANYGGYSGNMESPDFLHPTLVANPRRVDFGATIGF